MRILLATLMLVPLLAFAGAPALSVEGKWTITSMTTPKGPVPEELIKATPTLWEIRKGGTYKVTMTRAEKSREIEGGWTLTGDQLLVTETLIDGKVPVSAKRDETMTVKRKGKTMTLADDKGRSMTLELTK